LTARAADSFYSGAKMSKTLTAYNNGSRLYSLDFAGLIGLLHRSIIGWARAKSGVACRPLPFRPNCLFFRQMLLRSQTSPRFLVTIAVLLKLFRIND
jgi:hypothetical protein